MSAKTSASNSTSFKGAPLIAARLDGNFDGKGLPVGVEKHLWWIDPRAVRETPGESAPLNALQNAYVQGLARRLWSEGVERDQPFYGGVMQEEGETVIFLLTGDARLKAVLLAIQQGCPVRPIPVLIDPQHSAALATLA